MRPEMKKYKKIVSALLLAAVLSLSLSACGNGGDLTYGSNDTTSAADSTASVDSAVTSADDTASDSSSEEYITAENIGNAIKKAYGDSFLPDTEIQAEILESEFGITSDMCSEIYAVMPMIGFHPDRLVIIKPADGKENEVKSALENALKIKQEQSLQYPANAAKVSAAKVLDSHCYYCFMLLGAPDDVSQTEDEQGKFAQEQMEIGINAFNDFFVKEQ